MYICICHGITDGQIRHCAASGACCLDDLQRELGVATQCGRCGDVAKGILEEVHTSLPEPQPA